MNDMENYLNDQVGKAVQNSNDLPDQFFRSQNLRQQNMAQQSQISSSEQIIRALEGKMNRLAHENRMLQARIDDLNDPFAPPTEEEKEAMAFNRWRMENEEFEKKTYLSSFMFQARAYKELAIQMGMKEGLTPEQVVAMERDYMDRVLNYENKKEHYTNHSNIDFNDHFLADEYSNVLKATGLPNRIDEEYKARKENSSKKLNAWLNCEDLPKTPPPKKNKEPNWVLRITAGFILFMLISLWIF